jgi:tetratricopeptide (TPR) repeat protein
LQSEHYEQATVSYNSEDYPQALKEYYKCLKEDFYTFEPGEAGLVYHRIGNCLLKMRNFNEAVGSYQKALQDEDYTERSSIYVNLGTTLNGVGQYQEAVLYFDKALADTSYTKPYRAHMGKGTAYSKLGHYIEAGTAYRDAALDENNPNPVKALTNLANTFTQLGRPDDAAEAYLAILDFRVTGKTLDKTLENLGRAYVSAGRYQEGYNSFREALSREGFELSVEAAEDYRKARLALGVAVEQQAYVEPAAPIPVSVPTNPLEDTFAGFELPNAYPPEPTVQYPALAYQEDEDYGGGNVPHSGDTDFFTASDAALIASSKTQLRKERKLRHTGLKILLTIVIILIVALGAAVFAYSQGVGVPSQQTVIENFFKAHAAGDSIEDTWIKTSAEDQETLDRLLDGVAKSASVTIVSISGGEGKSGLFSMMAESQAIADVKLAEGGTVHYRIDLVRSAIGWKISGIELIFASQK